MDSFEELMRKLRDRAVEDAMRLDPAFAEKVEADRAELAEHEKVLEAQRLPSQKSPPIEQRRPEPEAEPGQSEKEILERINRAVIERREL